MFRLDGPGTSLSGRFVNCNMTGNACFGAENISGTFVNCSGDYNSFVGKNISGTFNNCRGNSGSFSSNAFDGTMTGTFINCIGGQSSFCPLIVVEIIMANTTIALPDLAPLDLWSWLDI